LISLALVVHVQDWSQHHLGVPVRVHGLEPWIAMLCWLAYFIVEIPPSLMGSRTARRAASGLRKTVDPHRDLRQASQKLAVNDRSTVGARWLISCLTEDGMTKPSSTIARR
jgi:hypothetical protein